MMASAAAPRGNRGIVCPGRQGEDPTFPRKRLESLDRCKAVHFVEQRAKRRGGGEILARPAFEGFTSKMTAWVSIRACLESASALRVAVHRRARPLSRCMRWVPRS